MFSISLTSWAAVFLQVPGTLPVPVIEVVVFAGFCSKAIAAVILSDC